MSFILDALKKSEAERQRQAGPALLEMRVVRPQRRLPLWLTVLGGTLIVVNLVGLVWLMLRPGATAPVAAPAAAASGATGAAAMPPATPLIGPGDRVIGPGTNSVYQGSAGATVPALVGSDDPLADDANPADFLPAESPRGARSGSALRNYADVSGEVPEMRLDLHVYDASPSRRYAFVNMKKVREGEQTADGAKVLEITRDGVVMAYGNTEFLLTSESSSTAGSAVPGGGNR